MRFRSKIDWWLYIVFVGWIAGNIWAILSYAINGGLGALIITISFTPFTVLLILPVLLKTYYELGDEELKIRSGLGKGRSINYNQIVSASETKNPTSSPALSMDRLEIKFRHKSGRVSDSIIISPKDKETFLGLLKEKNNDIEISTDIKPMSKGTKVLFGVTAAIIAVSGALILVGTQDAGVSVRDDHIKIGGMYGMNVGFSEIKSVTLVKKSMSEIYGGDSVTRTNGFGGIGQANKGHFRSSVLGAHMLFVQARTSPTIHIERAYSDIYISFRDGEKTEQLYREIRAAMVR